MLLHSSKGYKITTGWLAKKGYKPFYFQQQTWQHIMNGHSGAGEGTHRYKRNF